MRSTGIAVAAAIGLAVPSAAWSADAVNLMNRQPTKQELIEALTPAPPVVKTRGIRPVDRKQDDQATGSVDLAVHFEYNSAVLTAETKDVLATLAEALQSERLSPYVFMVEGHTDASGPESYNMKLSERRAKAVVDFLVSGQGVDPRQLSAIGKGESELLDGIDPNDGQNRRVRVRNLNAG